MTRKTNYVYVTVPFVSNNVCSTRHLQSREEAHSKAKAHEIKRLRCQTRTQRREQEAKKSCPSPKDTESVQSYQETFEGSESTRKDSGSASKSFTGIY